MKREESLVKNTLILSLGTFIPKLAAFITLPILTASLSKEEYGTYDLVLVLVSLILPAVTLQIQTAAFRFLIKCRDDKEKQKSIITNIYLFTIVVSIIALGILYLCLAGYSFEMRILILLYFLCDMINNTCLQIARGLGDNFSYAIGSIVGSLGKVALTVVGVSLLDGGLSAAILALIVATSLSAVYITVKSKLHRMIDFHCISGTELKELLSYSWPMVPNSLSMWVMNLSDRLVITGVLGLEANAVYSVANKIPSILSLAQSTFTMAWQENASLSSEDNDASDYYTKMFAVLFDFMVGFLACIVAFTPVLFKTLIRGDYGEAYVQSSILFLGVFFSSLSSFFGGIYVAYMKTKSVGITTMAAAVINLSIDILLVSKMGITAGSLSTAVSYFFLAVFRMINVRKLVEIKYDIKKIIKYLVVLIFMCIISSRQNIVLDTINLAIGLYLFWMLDRQIIIFVLNKIKKTLDRRM